MTEQLDHYFKMSASPKPLKAGPETQQNATMPVPTPGVAATTPMASPARLRRRHWGIICSFVVFIFLPIFGAGFYLFERSLDQYVSRVGFTVRTEDTSAALDILGGLGGLDSSSSSDTDILYEYIQSPELVRLVDSELDLRSVYSANFEVDPIFSFKPEGTIEDLTIYWNRMVKVFYDAGTGLMELRVHAFDPDIAQMIAELIVENSSRKINQLSAIARADATVYAREELDKSVERLKLARQSMTEFRSVNRILDPSAEIGVQTGLITALEQQLSDALIDSDLLRETSGSNDPRLTQAERRITAIRQRIEEERQKFGTSGVGGEDYSDLIGEYERLLVDKEFAEQAYLAALTAFDNAQTEAQRQSRYLVPYLLPTLAERPEYPQRQTLLFLIGVFLFFAWSILVLIYYSIKDRR